MLRPFRHPLASHAAGAILGYRRDGRPIYAIAGGSGDGGTAPSAPAAPAAPSGSTPAAPAAPTAPAAPAPAPQPTAPATPAAPAAPAPAPAAPAAPPQGEPQDVASLPEWAQKVIRDTRAEAADWRTRAQGSAPQPTAPAAPAAPQGEPAAPAAPAGPDPARQLAIQTAIIAAAPAAGADIARVLDSQAAMTALDAVDPANAEAVKQALTNVLATHRHLAAGPVRGGGEFGAPQGDRQAATLHDAIAARMGG
ncbi:hypothetical protein [Streptomyces sp. NPDC000994]